MGVFGPYTAVAGTVQQCACDPDAQAVYISNTTIYDLYVGVGAGKPTAVSLFGGYPWIRRIPQGDRAGMRLPLDRYSGAGFPGYVWVLPQVATTGFALNGAVSTNANFTVESYANLDEMPPDCASPQFQNASSQQRVISVPMSSGQFSYNGSQSFPASGTTAALIQNWVNVASARGGQFAVYFYYFYPNSRFNAAGAGGLEFKVQLDCQTAANASLGGVFPITILDDSAYWAAAAGPYGWRPFQPPEPIEIIATIPSAGSADHLAILFQNVTAANIPSQFIWDLAANCGQLVASGGSITTLGPIGNGSPSPVVPY